MPSKTKTPVPKRGAARRAPRAVATAEGDLNFTALVDSIRQVHEQSAALVNRTVNTTLTLRNWVIGAYIHHYELHGKDRAEYGDGLMGKLAEALERTHVTACDRIRLYLYLNFARSYPQVGKIVWQTLPGALLPDPIVRTLSEQFQPMKKVRTLTGQSPVAAEMAIRESLSPELGAPLPALVSRLSFKHEHLGQLNAYVAWYRKHMMSGGDNPPVGLLLCTGKDHALVEYATASMDNQLFVSKYAVELPSKAELEWFLDSRRREVAGSDHRAGKGVSK